MQLKTHPAHPEALLPSVTQSVTLSSWNPNFRALLIKSPVLLSSEIFKFKFFLSCIFFLMLHFVVRGTRWRGLLRHCATSRKVAGPIPDGVIGIFHWHNPSGRAMALGSTQSLTEMSTRNISWEYKVAGAYGWQPYHLHVLIVLKSGSLNLLEPSGPVQACNGIALPFTACKSQAYFIMLNPRLSVTDTICLHFHISVSRPGMEGI